MIFFYIALTGKRMFAILMKKCSDKKSIFENCQKVKCVKEALDYAGHNSLPFCGIFWRKFFLTFLDFLQS
jgi:hypothetical protein